MCVSAVFCVWIVCVRLCARPTYGTSNKDRTRPECWNALLFVALLFSDFAGRLFSRVGGEQRPGPRAGIHLEFSLSFANSNTNKIKIALCFIRVRFEWFCGVRTPLRDPNSPPYKSSHKSHIHNIMAAQWCAQSTHYTLIIWNSHKKKKREEKWNGREDGTCMYGSSDQIWIGTDKMVNVYALIPYENKSSRTHLNGIKSPCNERATIFSFRFVVFSLLSWRVGSHVFYSYHLFVAYYYFVVARALLYSAGSIFFFSLVVLVFFAFFVVVVFPLCEWWNCDVCPMRNVIVNAFEYLCITYRRFVFPSVCYALAWRNANDEQRIWILWCEKNRFAFSPMASSCSVVKSSSIWQYRTPWCGFHLIIIVDAIVVARRRCAYAECHIEWMWKKKNKWQTRGERKRDRGNVEQWVIAMIFHWIECEVSAHEKSFLGVFCAITPIICTHSPAHAHTHTHPRPESCFRAHQKWEQRNIVPNKIDALHHIIMTGFYIERGSGGLVHIHTRTRTIGVRNIEHAPDIHVHNLHHQQK